MPELRTSAEASDELVGVAGDADMEDLLGDEELERVFESIGEAEDSGRLEGVLQLAAKSRRHAGQARP